MSNTNNKSNLRQLNEQIIEHLYTSIYPKCVNYAYTFLKDREVAQDIVQDAIMSVWSKREDLDPDGNIEYYILSAIRNKAYNYLREKQQIAEKLGKKISTHESLGIIALSYTMPNNIQFEEMTKILENTIGAMNPKISSTFRLLRDNDMSYRYIAAKQKISLKSVEYRVSKAMQILRNALKDYL